MASNARGVSDARDLVVIGASAGGVEALREVVAGLPADLAAAVVVVLHMPAEADSAIADILHRSGPLPAASARHGEPLLPGQIRVSLPDRHLLVRGDRLHLSRAPKQNRVRPAIDVLFRSAARWSGARTVGVVLSGSLDDGAAGLAAINAVGGAAVVQHPADALYNGMPMAALSVVPNAVVSTASQLGSVVQRLLAEGGTAPSAAAADSDLRVEAEMSENEQQTMHGRPLGRPVAITCPDCTGGMSVLSTGVAVHYRCHIGHVWSPITLLAAQRERVEVALWTAVSILEEQASVHRELAARAADSQAHLTESHQRAAAEEICAAALVIRKHFPDMMPGTG